jgi:hypothetical protein
MRRLSALLCEKVVQPTGDSYSADHLIFGMGDAVLQESQTEIHSVSASNVRI